MGGLVAVAATAALAVALCGGTVAGSSAPHIIFNVVDGELCCCLIRGAATRVSSASS
jgi:hypothetical protein